MKLKNLLNFCWVSIFFDISIVDISWTVAQTPINHTILWKNVMRTFRCIYVNCVNRLKFLAQVSTKLQKTHFFRQFVDHNSGMIHINLTNDPFFHLPFPFYLFVTFIFCVWKKWKFIFALFSLWSILVCKIPQFWAKTTDSDSSSCFYRN